MTQHQSYNDASQGDPNIEALQYLQQNWGADEINSAVRTAKVSITAAASGSSGVDAVIPVGAEIIDVKCICKATVGGGTAQIKVGGGGAAISDAITFATADAVTSVGTIDTTYSTVGADGITVWTNADTNLGDVFIIYKK